MCAYLSRKYSRAPVLLWNDNALTLDMTLDRTAAKPKNAPAFHGTETPRTMNRSYDIGTMTFLSAQSLLQTRRDVCSVAIVTCLAMEITATLVGI